MNSKKAMEYLRFQKQAFARTMAPEMTLSMNEAISALEKQVPKKPIDKQGEYNDTVLSCPNCFNPVVNYLARGVNPAYCQCCGQALDWRDNE